MNLALATAHPGRLISHGRRQGARYTRWVMVTLGVFVAWVGFASVTLAAATPEAALKVYVKAIYARDSAAAYRLISRADRQLKTEQVYVRENGAFSGATLELASVLAALIRFDHLHTQIEGNRATVTSKITFPNANAPALRERLLEFDPARLDTLSPAERTALADQIGEMARTGSLPVLVGEDDRWELLQEDGEWRLYLNWAGAVEVRFEAATKAGLPWEFAPVQPVIRATPGETLQTFYRVRNLADHEITAKARHILDPPEETGYLEVVTCFCFFEQTLAAGETQELPVIFRVKYDAPESVRRMRVRYEFYPLEHFPK